MQDLSLSNHPASSPCVQLPVPSCPASCVTPALCDTSPTCNLCAAATCRHLAAAVVCPLLAERDTTTCDSCWDPGAGRCPSSCRVCRFGGCTSHPHPRLGDGHLTVVQGCQVSIRSIPEPWRTPAGLRPSQWGSVPSFSVGLNDLRRYFPTLMIL